MWLFILFDVHFFKCFFEVSTTCVSGQMITIAVWTHKGLSNREAFDKNNRESLLFLSENFLLKWSLFEQTKHFGSLHFFDLSKWLRTPQSKHTFTLVFFFDMGQKVSILCLIKPILMYFSFKSVLGVNSSLHKDFTLFN